jgi:hypothetical protein
MTEINPIKLDMFFTLSHGFKTAWEQTVSRAADQAMATALALPEPERLPWLRGSGLEEFLDDWPGPIPWPYGCISDELSQAVTFNWYAGQEIDRRLELIRKKD